LIIEYDKNPNATVDQKVGSLRDSCQRAFDALEDTWPVGSVHIRTSKSDPGKELGGKWQYLTAGYLGKKRCYYYERVE
jgi:hypothetical protein